MHRTLMSAALASFTIAACSGATGSDDLFKGAVFSASSSSGATSGASGGASSSGGSSGASTSSGGASSGGSTSGGGSSSSGGFDAGTDATVFDAGPKDPGIYCGDTSAGTTYCKVGAQICCALLSGTGGNPGYTCRQGAAQCTAGIPISCDDAADCPGQICCGHFSSTTGYRSVSCAAACDGTDPNGDALVQFCDVKSVPDECPVGRKCTPSGSLIGFSRCQ